MSDKKIQYKHAPGRGLMSDSAYEMRADFFKTLVKDYSPVLDSNISLDQVQNNLESFIGSTEIPMGLIGPLLYNENPESSEWVYSGLCTTEGALVASLNRGAKAISESGGFQAHFVHQKMIRSPLFTFTKMAETVEFEKWLVKNFDRIKEQTSKFSNHADLKEIKVYVTGKLGHLKFIFSTSDASGQNMVTHCTWQACLWIEEQFQKETGIEIIDFYVDGNGSSDKKVSFYSLMNGRGVHVVCECLITHEVIEKTLRSTAHEMFVLYSHSMAISRFDGIIGGTLNIANVIAGIFAATGQDLGSIHESSLGITQIDEVEEGLYLSLSIPALVIGTVGGGTHLSVPKSILELMGCYGNEKLERFAKLIAGFCLSLEVSTLAALASGQFARAHQKLGKNKTVNWLLKSDVDTKFLQKHLGSLDGEPITSSEMLSPDNKCDGILTNLAKRVTKKLIGFYPLMINGENGSAKKILIKSKPLDNEHMKGLHFMASNINTELADLLFRHSEFLEYKDSHKKEIEVYDFLDNQNFRDMPVYYSGLKDDEREIYLIFFEYLSGDSMKLMNSENEPDRWMDDLIMNALSSIHKVHKAYLDTSGRDKLKSVKLFELEKSIPFYKLACQVNKRDYAEWGLGKSFDEIAAYIDQWEKKPPRKKSLMTMVHNDFNPRNVGIRKDGSVCIYDWELAVINIPQRDTFEFLSFTLCLDFSRERLLKLLNWDFKLVSEINPPEYSWDDYIDDLIISGYEFLISRASFYLAGNTLLNYRFIKRVFIAANRIIEEAGTLHGKY